MAKDSQTPKFGALSILIASSAVALVALLVYSLSLAGYAYPGQSTHLFTQWTGLDALRLPQAPVWAVFVKMFAGLGLSSSVAVSVNMLSLACGVISTALVCALVAFFVRITTRQEDAVKFSGSASIIAGVVAAFVFVFTTSIWKSSTHLEYRIFDICYALVVCSIFMAMIRFPKFLSLLAIVLGIGTGIGFVETVIFIPISLIIVLCLVLVSLKSGKKFYLPTALFFIFALVTFLIVSQSIASSFMLLPEAKSAGFESSSDVVVKMIQSNMREIRMWWTRPGWLFIFILAVVPFVSCMFASPRGLNNERTWSQYLFHFSMMLTCILAFATPLAPGGVLAETGIDPVATSTIVAFTCGYVAAYWYLLARCPLPHNESRAPEPVYVIGRRAAPGVLGFFLVILVLAAFVNAFSSNRDAGKYADYCANEIVDRLGERKWIVTDGMLDDHIRMAANSRGKEVNLICLQRDMDDGYLKELGSLIKEKNLTAGRANLSLSIQLGVLPFLQDWFAGNTNITQDAAIFGVPDFWFMADRQPVPECMFFGGVRSVKKDFDGAKALAEFKEFWKKTEPVLHAEKRKGSREIYKSKNPVDALRLQLRRHVGFVCNNLGVALQDAGMDKEAFEAYELVLKTIDCDNICALFNEFEMARTGNPEALKHKQEIEKALKAIVDDPKRRYMLWSLSRYYGYIRSPEIFARMGYAWARSGQTGNAISQVQRAIEFVPADRQTGLLNMMAAIYASGNQMQKSRDVYNKVLSSDSTNHDALMGLTRLALKNGSIEEAKGYLSKAVKTAKNAESTGFDWALLHMMNNDLSAARLSLQKVTDLQPKSLQAWSLLAGVLLQQFDNAKDEAAKKKILAELDTTILPKMEAIANSPRDYFVQMTRALVLMRKGIGFQKQARDALIAASATRPDVTVVGDMILNLDISMNDGESAEKHARQVLRQDRSNKLANYVMGSLRLKDGDYMNAETFLRLSVEQERPLPAALNDLSEVLRRLQRFEEAEKYAREAIKIAPDLYVAWETLGSALLDQNKGLDEAEICVKKAIELTKQKNNIEDIRMQITLARVQIAKGDVGRARSTLRAIRAKQSELSKYDLNEVEKLQKALKTSKK